ncbi:MULTISPECIES: helix-turn-helix domain-containing protein [Burkholderia]|uniref:helix-turn-helix domain-containing protein n=1 Tax=Burkholderia TaxID=32008 RepID=UPI00032805E1|nr:MULTISPECIES: helix-turn-helix domain-containing protein [Burkholderia]AGK50782.1 DNA binding, excisionase family domain protein [Burkholderia thailandensis MSMB121]ATF33413.1 DNA-binding protein [Burkholderia thailandensis]KST71492.1 DNA-binding protein [Burkholderia humptydooensis]KVN20106.1 DNA-binding protein [Burkholderia sp. MSMB1552]KWZ49607.1 DNA-binding protein [Burkholderia sp. MSMB1588]
MLEPFHTVDEAAERLRLHPKTVLRFIREGRLRATRIGKAYRIARADLDAFAGAPPDAAKQPPPARVTCVADLQDASPELHSHVARSLQAMLSTHETRAHPVHLETIFDPAERRLKVVIVASAGDAAALLGMLDTLAASFAR